METRRGIRALLKIKHSVEGTMEEPNNTVTGDTHSPHMTDSKLYQSSFRKGLNERYENKRAICGMNIEELWKGSHIVPCAGVGRHTS
jgi:predicted restriction endonuclease